MKFKIFQSAVLFTCLFLIFSTAGNSQKFQRTFGNGQDNYFHKAVPLGPAPNSGYYVIGSEDNHGIVSRISNSGQILWTMKFIDPCAFFDAESLFTTPGQPFNLVVAGATLPFNNTNKSLLMVITPAGGLLTSDLYDVAQNGVEGFTKIARKNGGYAVTGFFNDPSFSTNVIMLDVSPTGAINSTNLYGNLGDNGYFYDVETMFPNEYIVAGYDGNAGVIFRLDNSVVPPTFVAGVRDPSVQVFNDMALDGTNIIAAGTSITPGGKPLLRCFDVNLFPIWTMEVSGLDVIHQVEKSFVNNDIYLVGTRNISGVDRAVVVRFTHTPNGPQYVWAKYFDNGETGHVTGQMTILPNAAGDIAFADGKAGIPGNFGQGDAFLAVTNDNLDSYCTKNHSVSFMADSPFLEGPELDFMDFTTLTPVGGLDFNTTVWQQISACADPCVFACPKSTSFAGTLSPPAVCGAVVNNIGPIVSGGCDFSTVTYSITGATTGSGADDASGTHFMQGISTVNYSATDMSGNMTTCSFDVNVECGWIPDTVFQDHITQCGADADFFTRLGLPAEDAVLTIPVSSFPASAIVHCGKYDVYFEDLITPQKGYGDPAGNVGLARINTLCAVLTYLQSVFDYSNVPANTPIRLYVSRSFSAINPAPPTTAALAFAGPFFNNAGTPSLINGFVYDYLKTGIDPAGANGYHAFLTTNFDQAFNPPGTPVPINWLDDYQQPMINCYYDLFSVLLHEMGHTMGWMSFIHYDLNNYPESTLGNDQYSGLDFTYYSGATPPFTSADKLVTGTAATPQINPIFATDATALDAIWTSPNAPPKNDPVYSGSKSFVNGFGWSFAAKSILSHLDEQMWSYSKRARVSPGDVQDYVMGPFGVKGILRRNFTDTEINKLLDLGYVINPGYTGTTLANFPPYSIKMAGYNSIFNDDFPDAIPADYTITNSGSVSLTINLATDPMLMDPEGDPISVFPGSLTNIRGCGNGGNNHNQLTVSGQTITYTPRPDFYGRAQFGFKLFDGKEAGSYQFYTIDVLRGTNNLAGCPPGSNLILNGDLEEGTEVMQLGANEAIGVSVMDESFLREGKMRLGIHFADAQPYCYMSNSWGPYGSGEKIKDSRIYCNGTTYQSEAGAWQTSIPGVFSAPNTNGGVGERFKSLAGAYNYFNLCDDVQECHRYVLEFDYYTDNFIPNGATVPVTVGFTNAATYPGLPVLTYSFIHNITTIGTSWQHVSIPFTYCGSTPASMLNLQQTVYYHGFVIDNLSLTEDLTPPPPLVVNITPLNPTINSGSSVTLSASVANALCNVTYNWSPGNTAAITVSPTVATSYTVSVNDGCRSAVANTLVNIAPEPCTCALPNIIATQSGQSFNLACTQGAPTPALPCPADDVTVVVSFGCEDANGNPCTDTPVDWKLTGPLGVISFGTSPTNNFTLTFLKADVDDVGTYYLELSTLCNGATDPCTCTARWIREDCDACMCGTFNSMSFKGVNQSSTCGGPPVTVGCPKLGNSYSYVFRGQYTCQGNCQPLQTINWALSGPSGTTSGYAQHANTPYFAVGLPPTYFTQNGLHTLTLMPDCDGIACPPCVIQFNVSCPSLCPCDVADFGSDLSKGFSVTKWNNSCKACFTPNALTDCDMVEWFVGGISQGMVSGTQTFCHVFPHAGIFNVMMSVTRKKSDGTVCATGTIAKNVGVACGPIGDCGGSVYANPRFSEGAVAGGLNSGGVSDGWNAPWGEPMVMEGEPGSTDAWTIQLSGNFDTSGVLSTFEPVCLEKTTGTITARFAIKHKGTRGRFVFELYREEGFELNNTANYWNPIRCLRPASIDLDPLDEGWYELEIPFDLSEWDTFDLCGDYPGVLVRPAIYVYNALGNNQGGAETFTVVNLDNFCLDGTLVDVGNPWAGQFFRLFPNPASNSLTLQLGRMAVKSGQVQIFDLWGRKVQTEMLPAGVQEHKFAIASFPAGVYFVKLLDGSEPLWVTKVLKH
jgi:hypothetical protein